MHPHLTKYAINNAAFCLDLQAMEREVEHFQTFLWWIEGFQRETWSETLLIQEGDAGVLSQVLNVEQLWTPRSQITAGRGKIKVQTLETKATLVLSSQVPETEPNTGFLFIRFVYVNSHTCQLPTIILGAIGCYCFFFFCHLLLLVLVDKQTNSTK